MKKQTWRVLIVDDSKYFDDHLWQMVIASPMLEIVGLTCNKADTLTALTTLSPDVILIDLSQATRKKLQLIKMVHHHVPRTPIFALAPTLPQEIVPIETYARAAQRAGAVDALAKTDVVATLWPALETALLARTTPAGAIRQAARNSVYLVNTLLWLIKSGVQWPQHMIGAGLGLIGGATGVALAIGLLIMVQMVLPPAVVFFPQVIPLMVMAILAALGAAWLFGQGVNQFYPQWFRVQRDQIRQVIPLYSAFACLVQVFLFAYGV